MKWPDREAGISSTSIHHIALGMILPEIRYYDTCKRSRTKCENNHVSCHWYRAEKLVGNSEVQIYNINVSPRSLYQVTVYFARYIYC